MLYVIWTRKKTRPGIEPGSQDPESCIIPLDHRVLITPLFPFQKRYAVPDPAPIRPRLRPRGRPHYSTHARPPGSAGRAGAGPSPAGSAFGTAGSASLRTSPSYRSVTGRDVPRNRGAFKRFEGKMSTLMDKNLYFKGITPRVVAYTGGGMVAWYGIDAALRGVFSDPSYKPSKEEMEAERRKLASLNRIDYTVQEIASILDKNPGKLTRSSPYGYYAPIELNNMLIDRIVESRGGRRNATSHQHGKRRRRQAVPLSDRMEQSQTAELAYGHLFNFNIKNIMGFNTTIDITIEALAHSLENGYLDDSLFYAEELLDFLERVMSSLHDQSFPYFLYSAQQLDEIVLTMRQRMLSLGLDVLPFRGADLRHLPITYIYANGNLHLITSVPVVKDKLSFLLFQYEPAPTERYGELMHLGPSSKRILAVNPRTKTFKAMDGTELAACRLVGERMRFCQALNSAYLGEETLTGPNQIGGTHDSVCLYAIYTGNVAATVRTCTLFGESTHNDNYLSGDVMVTSSKEILRNVDCIANSRAWEGPLPRRDDERR